MNTPYIVAGVLAVALVGGLVWVFGGGTTPVPMFEQEAEAPAELAGTAWEWQGTELNDGSVVLPNQPGVFGLEFTHDAQVSGRTDCNSFFGPYNATPEGVITFGPLASTLMFCEGSQEGEFMQMVGDSENYLITPDGNLVLLIKFGSGSVIFAPRQ